MARYSQTQTAPDVSCAIQEYSRARNSQPLAKAARKMNSSSDTGERYRSLLLMQMLAPEDPDLLSALGDRYFQGSCVREDKTKAREIFQQAADQGSVRSSYDLAWYYYERKELLQAIDYFKRCIDAQANLEPDMVGMSYSCLGSCYANLPDPKVSDAITNLTIAADKYHDAFAARRLGMMYREKDSSQFSMDKCFHYLEQAAQGNDMVAVEILGSYYTFGNSELGVQPDWRKAEAVLLPHADSGSAAVLRYLGNIYLLGDQKSGISSNHEKAREFCERSLALEYNAVVEADLGCAYFQLDQYRKAEELLLKADQNNILYYSDFLASMYQDGKLGAADPKKALYYYQRAYSAKAINNIFTCVKYMDLLEQMKNYSKAYEVAEYGEKKYNDIVFLFTKARLVLEGQVTNRLSQDEAAEVMEAYTSIGGSNALQAHLMLGHYYLDTRDYHKAEDHYLQAFQKGESDAAVYLGWLYEEGGGAIKADPDKAHAWFARAAEAGSALGIKELSCWRKGIFGGWKRVANLT